MQPINATELEANRNKLIAWQFQQWSRPYKGVRLHLGSGHLHLNNYINIDPYTLESDSKEDMRKLSYGSNTVDEIVCQHSIEHLPIRDVWKALNHWYDILKEGGTLEIGIPDLELCCQSFLEGTNSEKYNKLLWTIYGLQTDPEAAGNVELTPRGSFPFSPGQVHMSGFSLGYFIRMLEDIGFRMIDAYNYDGYGTPSLFVYAIKPVKNQTFKSVLEKDAVIGVFSNETVYMPLLWQSANKHIPQIPFITRFNRGFINAGMSLLREDFIKSGKRYWCFLDSDIQFLNSDIIANALNTLVEGKYGAVSVYSTFDAGALTNQYDPGKFGLVARPHKWATGYFIMVDSHKVGHILPDMNLPHPNTSIDTSYSVSIRAAGYGIGISPDYVYHTYKTTRCDQKIVDITNEYLMNKWGQFYYDWTGYDGNVIEWGTGAY